MIWHIYVFVVICIEYRNMCTS